MVVFLVDIIRCSNVLVVSFKYLRKKLVPVEIRERVLLRDSWEVFLELRERRCRIKVKTPLFSETIRETANSGDCVEISWKQSLKEQTYII